MYALGIDLGTTFTAAAVWRDGRAEISSLGSRGAAIPSVVVLREDETIITGETAQRRALTSPHRVAREFKRRLGDTTPILLAGVPYSAEALMARVLRAVVDEVSAREGGPPSTVCVSHPANWGPYKTDLLHQAVRSANLEDASFTIEPVAAAVFYARQQRMPDDAVIAVYDLGGGTFDAAVLRKSADGFEILGRPEGIERLGGIDFDAAVFAHVSRALGGALEELDDEDQAAITAVARLKDECTQAKEALSADTDTTIPVLLPNLSTEVRLTRAELESMVRPALQDTIDALRRALRSAGVAPDELHSVLLVGGSSRMPIVSQLVGAELGRPVAVDAHPKHAVALGAAMVAGSVVSAVAEPEAPAPVAPAPVAPAPAASTPVAKTPAVPTPVATSPAAPIAAASAAAALASAAASPAAASPVAAAPVAASKSAAPARSTSKSAAPQPDSGPATAVVQPITETQVFPAATGFASTRTPDPRSGPARQPSAKSEAPPMDFWDAGADRSTATQTSGSGGLGTGTQRRQGTGSGRGRVLAAAASVAVIALGAAGIAAALMNRDDDPTTPRANLQDAVTATTAPGQTDPAQIVPADEQCTDEIKANKRWVCLTSAKFKGDTLTIRYRANFADAEPNVHGGYHLHIYGGDGVTPAAEIEGRQALNPGHWYVEDENPSVRRASSKDYRQAIGDAPKVCARIATSTHTLVRDKDGSYVTGNCVPIDREDFSTSAPKRSNTSGGSGSSGHSTTTWPTTPPPTTTPPPPTTTPTDLTLSTASVETTAP